MADSFFHADCWNDLDGWSQALFFVGFGKRKIRNFVWKLRISLLLEHIIDFVFYCIVDFVCEFLAFSDEATLWDVYDGADLFECECFPELRLLVLRVAFP